MSRDGGLRPMFTKKLPSFFWVPIETPISGGGVPDHYFCKNGADGWNEYKLVTRGWSPSFRPEQIGWHSRLARAGGRSFIIIRRYTDKADELWIYRGKSALAFRSASMYHLSPALKHVGGPSAWDWDGIADFLVSDLTKPRG